MKNLIEFGPNSKLLLVRTVELYNGACTNCPVPPDKKAGVSRNMVMLLESGVN